MKKVLIISLSIIISFLAITNIYNIYLEKKLESYYAESLKAILNEQLNKISFVVEGKEYIIKFKEFYPDTLQKMLKRNKEIQFIDLKFDVYEKNDDGKLNHISSYSQFIFIKVDYNKKKIKLYNDKNHGTIVGRLHFGFVSNYFSEHLKTSFRNNTSGHGHYNEDLVEINSEGDILNNAVVNYEYNIREIDRDSEKIVQDITFKSSFRVKETEKINIKIIKNLN